MKLIVAIIWPERFEAVQAVLDEPDARLISVSDVGGGRVLTEMYRGAEMRVLQPRRRVEIMVMNDAMVRETVEKIANAAAMDNSKNLGGGEIMVFEVADCVSIRCASRDPQLTRRVPGEAFAAFSMAAVRGLGKKLFYPLLVLAGIGISAYYLLPA